METTNLPTILTQEIKDKIAELVAGGLSVEYDKEKIAQALGIPLDTLKELFIKDRQDRLLKKAELTSEELLDIDLNDPNIERIYGKNKIQVMKLVQSEAQFIRESLGKDQGYSKRTEVTGRNGEEIRIKEIIFNAPIAVKPIDATTRKS